MSLEQVFFKVHAMICFLIQFNLNTASYLGMESKFYCSLFIIIIIINIIIIVVVIIAYLFLAGLATESTAGRFTVHSSSWLLQCDVTQTIRYLVEPASSIIDRAAFV